MGDTAPLPPDQAHLPWAARRAHELSETTCTHGCGWFHGIWGYARLYGVMPAVLRTHDELLSMFGAAFAHGRRRVLLSGSSDQGLAAYAIAAAEAAGVTAEITVTDLCETPLQMARDYAGRVGWTVRTIAADARDVTGGPYDLIVAHNFLQFFPSEQHAVLARHWASLLAPDGRVVLFQRVYANPGAGGGPRFPDPAPLVAAFAEAQAASPHADLIAADALERMVRTYASKRIRKSAVVLDRLCADFATAGLTLQETLPIERAEPGIPSSNSRLKYMLGFGRAG